MKYFLTYSTLALAVCLLSLFPQGYLAQACGDENTMVENTSKDLTDFVVMVQKEDLRKFEEAYHQRSCITKLSICLSIVDEAEKCLEKGQRSAKSEVRSLRKIP